MKARLETILWLAQRLSAGALIVGAVIHVSTNVYAVRGGLSAAEVIDRIQGNGAWLAFYLVFAAAAAVHGPLGLRTILNEMTPVRGRAADAVAVVLAVALVWLGWRAAFGLFAFGGA